MIKSNLYRDEFRQSGCLYFKKAEKKVISSNENAFGVHLIKLSKFTNLIEEMI